MLQPGISNWKQNCCVVAGGWVKAEGSQKRFGNTTAQCNPIRNLKSHANAYQVLAMLDTLCWIYTAAQGLQCPNQKCTYTTIPNYMQHSKFYINQICVENSAHPNISRLLDLFFCATAEVHPVGVLSNYILWKLVIPDQLCKAQNLWNKNTQTMRIGLSGALNPISLNNRKPCSLSLMRPPAHKSARRRGLLLRCLGGSLCGPLNVPEKTSYCWISRMAPCQTTCHPATSTTPQSE